MESKKRPPNLFLRVRSLTSVGGGGTLYCSPDPWMGEGATESELLLGHSPVPGLVDTISWL